MPVITRRRILAGAALVLAGPAIARAQGRQTSAAHAFVPVPLTKGLVNPWAVALLPDGRFLITERPGRLRIVGPGGLDPQPVAGVPAVVARGQGGLLDVIVHPQFAANGLVFLSYAGSDGDGGSAGTRVVRARFDGTRLNDVRVIFDGTPHSGSRQHFGCRLVIGRDGLLYVSTGDRGERDRSQRLNDLAGKIARITVDGQVPPDNPFVGRAGVRAAIYCYGVRNAQGMTMHPATGTIWQNEHGARGGDEINIVRAGANYGWPLTTHGVDYNGSVISPHRSLPGIIDPVHVWTPSIAPSGTAFCTGDAFPLWRGNAFVGGLVSQLLMRLEIDGERVVREEPLLRRVLGRIRDVRCGPDGRLYVLTDDSDGGLFRLDPA